MLHQNSEEVRAEAVMLESLAKVLATVVQAKAVDVDRLGEFPHESYQALATAGLAGLLVPAEFGGQNSSSLTYVKVMENISAVCGSTSTVYMTQMHCAYPILLAGSNRQKQTFLRPLCQGEIYGAIALTEPDAGSDVSSMSTLAQKDGSDYLINGQKTFISNGDRAGVVALFCTTDRQRGKDGITAFLIEQGTPGFTSGPPMHKLGQRGASTSEIFLSDCRVPSTARLGEEGDGYALLISSVMKSRLSAAAQGIGFARGAFDRTASFFANRGELSGRRRDAQDIQFALADMASRIEAARALLHRTAQNVDNGDVNQDTEIAMCKLHCTDLATSVASEAVEILGEDGDRINLGVERQLRDAKATQIYDGTNQIQRMLISRSIRTAFE